VGEGVVISLDMPDADYRAVPALSYSGAKDLMRSPALFAWRQDHPRPDSTDFDLGHATEAQLLGVGDPITVVRDANTGEPYTSWVPKARALRDEARANGETPLLLEQADAVDRMVSAVRSHPEAGKLFEPGRGHAQPSLFWTDDETQTAQRARLDWLLVEGDDGRPEVLDLKTTTDVRRRALAKTIDEHRYHWQDPHYCAALAAHGVDDVRFRFVFVEKSPPHLVRVVELDEDAWHTGARWMAAARRLYAACLDAGDWPAYPARTEVIGLPAYSPRDPEDVLL
jgi:hypothetical protein